MKKIFLTLMLLFSVVIYAQKIQNKIVDAGCGMCMFKLRNDRSCAMAVKIDNKIYYVEGLKEETFGDAHADDGFCNVMKKAQVSGEIKRGKFYAKSFKYLTPGARKEKD